MKRTVILRYGFAFIVLFELLLVLGGGVTGQGQAPAALLVVNSADDTAGDSCHPAYCTLRQAITVANNTPEADMITFALPADTVITLAGSQLPPITGTLTIDGGTALNLRVSGGDTSSIFQIRSAATVTLTALTITDGDVYGGGAGIFNEGTLTLLNSAISNNFATAFAGISNNGVMIISNTVISGNLASHSATFGGGIGNNGTLTINDSTISNNQAVGSSAGGGGIYNNGTLTINNSTISDNKDFGMGNGGGGIHNAGGTVIVNNSTLSHNQSSISGGGISNGSILVINNSTVHDNVTGNSNIDGMGGGIYNEPFGTVMINNSTFTANIAKTGFGGGVYNTGSMVIINSTLSGNIAEAGGGIYLAAKSLLDFSNTIVANSIANEECVNDGAIATNLNNLVEDGSCEAMFNGDPLLGPLQNNGGSTATHALLPGSPAVDAGDNPTCLATDQRGFIRPADGDEDGSAICDIGAFELYPGILYLPIIIKN